MAFTELLQQFTSPTRLTSVIKSAGKSATHAPGASISEYQALPTDALAPETETVILQDSDGSEMGFQEQFEKPEGRQGDSFAQLVAAASIGTFLAIVWVTTLASGSSFKWFAWHPLFQSLGIALFSYGILTLQPTSQPKTKAAGLTRHQLAMIILGFPVAFLGYAAIFASKMLNDRPHFTTWHGKLGLLTFCLLAVQILLGGGSVWFDGMLFGGNPKAKFVWKYHRVVGYATFFFLLLTAHLGGAWSTWSMTNSPLAARVLAYTFAPAALIVAIYSRARLSKMRFT